MAKFSDVYILETEDGQHHYVGLPEFEKYLKSGSGRGFAKKRI